MRYALNTWAYWRGCFWAYAIRPYVLCLKMRRKYAFFAVAPFAGAEYALTDKVNLVAKIDWLLNVTNPQDDFTTGPRLYIGFMFGHAD